MKQTNSRLMIDGSDDFGGFGASVQKAMEVIEDRLDELTNVLGTTEDSDDLDVDDIACGTITCTDTAASSLVVGPNGATNPMLKVNCATTSAATGISITGAAAAGGVAVAAISSGDNENLSIDAKGSGTITLGATSTGGITLTRAVTCSSTLGATTLSASTAVTVTSANAAALAVGLAGATNPAFVVDASTASSATGVKVKSAAAAGGVAVSVVSSGTNENLTIDAKGSGTVTINGTGTGAITLTRAVTCSSTLASGALTVAVAALGADGRIAKLTGSSAAANYTDGYGAVEIELTLSGTIAGMTAASSTWINVTGASVDAGSQVICVQNNGIYVTATGTPMDGAIAIIGMRMQYVAEGGGDPGALYCFDTNISDNVLTAIFRVNDKVDIGWADGVLSSATGDGHVPLFKDKDGAVHYVNTFLS